MTIYLIHDKETPKFFEENANIAWPCTTTSIDFDLFITCAVIV